MNRPEKKSAIDPTRWRELLETFAAVAERPEDRVVVLTGAGGAFCPGADLSPAGANARIPSPGCATSLTLPFSSTACPSPPSPRSGASPPGPGSTWPWAAT
jgi:hypothetical protein